MPDQSNQTQRASAYTALGTARTEKVTLPEATFDGVINMPVMHQAVKAFMANQRQGNASTKIRKYVVGGNQKPWKQKGTGRARQGSTRAPHFVGGGTVFGPTPRPYDEYVPRQVRALAKKSALNARANDFPTSPDPRMPIFIFSILRSVSEVSRPRPTPARPSSRTRRAPVR